MKKALILFSCILFVFASCKKNNNITPSNTISADIDGVNETFNSNTYAQLGNGVTQKSSLSIFGANGANTDADQMSITMVTNNTIITSSYVSGSDNIGLVSIEYNKGPFSLTNSNTYATDVNGSPSTVVITSLTSTNVQGTFSGRLVDGSATKTVTNGKFNLPLK